MDLWLEYRALTQPLTNKIELVHSHQDKNRPRTNLRDLEATKLPSEAIHNILCTKRQNKHGHEMCLNLMQKFKSQRDGPYIPRIPIPRKS